MADKTSALAKADAFRAEVAGIGVAPPPPPPSGAGVAWFTSKASGSITNIGANVLQSKNPWAPSAGPGTVGFRAILAASGAAFCPWRGAAGSLIIFGGGHNDYHGNDVYEFDCATQTYAQLKPANWPLFQDALTYQADGTNGEHWTDATFTTTRQDQPSSGHNYGQLDAIAPNAQFPQGAVITYARLSIPTSGQRHGKRAHVFDFATKAWRRFSTGTFPDGVAFGGGCVDKVRNRAVVSSDRALFTLDLATGVIGPKFGNYPSGVAHMVWHHDVAHDVYIGFVYRLGAPLLWVVDPVTSAWTAPGVAGTWPTPGLGNGGSCWSELLGGIAHYHGQGESVVSIIKPPATGNVRTTAWPVTSLAFTGDAPVNDTMSGAGAHCKRFLEHKDAGGFLWLGQTSAAAQFFRVVASAAPLVGIVAIGLVFAASGFSPWAAAQTFKRGDVPIGAQVVADCAEFQCVPVNFHDDGSMRDAHVAGYCQVAAPGRHVVMLSRGQAAAGVPVVSPPVNVQVFVDGALATWDAGKVIAAGPVMTHKQHRATISPVLRVLLEVRTFAHGEVEAFVPTLQNAGFITAAQPAITAAVRVVAGGVERFNETVTLAHHTRVAAMRGRAWCYYLGGQAYLPDHDRAYLCASESFPPYAVRPASAAKLAALPRDYAPNYIGDSGSAMGNTGYRPGIGVLGLGNVYPLTSGGQAAWDYMHLQALSMGSWSTHYCDETTGEVPIMANYPKHGWRASAPYAVSRGSGVVNGSDDVAHHFSQCYAAAKLTGWQWFRDEQLSWAVRNYMSQHAIYRFDAKGILRTDSGSNQVRGGAWALRTLFQTASLLPADSPHVPGVLYQVEQNVAWYRARYVDGTLDGGAWVNNLGFLGTYTANVTVDRSPYGGAERGTSVAYWDAPWQHSWVTAALGQAIQLALPINAQGKADLRAAFDQSAKLIVGLCGDGGPSSFNWRRFGMYGMPLWADATSVVPGQWFANFGQVRAEYETAHALGAIDPAPGGDLKQAKSNNAVTANDWTTGRIGFFWPALVYAVMHKAAGADAALARVMSSSSWPLIAAASELPLWGGMMPPGFQHPGA